MDGMEYKGFLFIFSIFCNAIFWKYLISSQKKINYLWTQTMYFKWMHQCQDAIKNLSIGGIKVLFFCVATCLDSMVGQLWCCPTRSGVVSILFTPRLVFQHTEQPKPVMLSDWQREWEPEAKRKTLYTKVDQKKFVFDFATDEKRFFSTTYITLQQPNARWKP